MAEPPKPRPRIARHLFVLWLLLLAVLALVVGNNGLPDWVLRLWHTSPAWKLFITQTGCLILFWLYLLGRLHVHIRFLSREHPTLGNFTNIKYTECLIIRVSDLLLFGLFDFLLLLWIFF